MSKRKRERLEPAGDPKDPQGMAFLMGQFLESLRVKNFSADTETGHRQALRRFSVWAVECGILRPCEVTKPILERYQRYLFHYRQKNGEPLSFLSQHHLLVPLRNWFKWLARQNFILYNPASELELPKLGRRLPKYVFTVGEAEQVLAVPDVNTPLGIRDRAMLETLYSTGIRRAEIVKLRIYDVDRDRGTVMVREGKGKNDRIVPIGERALAWIDKYLEEVRPGLLSGDGSRDALFLTRRGEPLSRGMMSLLGRKYIAAADIGKMGGCHVWRHTAATLLLDAGADTRFIQAFLGHAHLTSTQIYTQVSIRQLKRIHEACHPSSKLKRPVEPPSDEERGPAKPERDNDQR